MTLWSMKQNAEFTYCAFFIEFISKQFGIYFTSTMVRFRYFIKQQLPPVRGAVGKTCLYRLGRLWTSSTNLTRTNSSVGTRRANVSDSK